MEVRIGRLGRLKCFCQSLTYEIWKSVIVQDWIIFPLIKKENWKTLRDFLCVLLFCESSPNFSENQFLPLVWRAYCIRTAWAGVMKRCSRIGILKFSRNRLAFFLVDDFSGYEIAGIWSHFLQNGFRLCSSPQTSGKYKYIRKKGDGFFRDCYFRSEKTAIIFRYFNFSDDPFSIQVWDV